MHQTVNTLRARCKAILGYLITGMAFGFVKSGVHGGPIVVTWVGELKKEILYLGDVVNTTARIQEDCKRLGKDFLISEDVLQQLHLPGDIRAEFVEETASRGKEKRVRLYSLSLV